MIICRDRNCCCGCSVGCGYALNFDANFSTHQWRHLPGMVEIEQDVAFRTEYGVIHSVLSDAFEIK